MTKSAKPNTESDKSIDELLDLYANWASRYWTAEQDATECSFNQAKDQIFALLMDVAELCVVNVFFEDLMLDVVAESKPLTRYELYEKLEELRQTIKANITQ